MDKLDAMRVFVQVAETASFTQAANNLNLPKASVSAAIRQLETMVQTRLLVRSTRNVSLSADGKLFLGRCLDVLMAADELADLFKPEGSELVGSLRLDVPSRFARLVLIPALPEFLRAHPQLHISLSASDQAIDLVKDGVDCVLRFGKLANDSSLVARPLGLVQMLSCASPGYLSRHGLPRSLDDLQSHQLIAYPVADGPGRARWDCWVEGNAHSPLSLSLPSQIAVSSTESYLACALAGLGLIQAPAFDVQPHLERGDLQTVLAQHPPPPLPLHALFPHRRHLSPKLRALLDWLAQLTRQLKPAPQAPFTAL